MDLILDLDLVKELKSLKSHPFLVKIVELLCSSQ